MAERISGGIGFISLVVDHRFRKPQGVPAALLRDVVFDAMLGGAP